MVNALPILLFGAGALLLMGRKKRKKKAPTPLVEQPHAELPPMVAPPKKNAGSATVKKRQQSLVDTGYDIGPAGVDGKMGPDTRAAIRAFQSDASITIDGLWGPQTAAAMAQALRMAVEGLGRAAYGQIGSMLEKFKGTFEKFFKPGEGGKIEPLTPPEGTINYKGYEIRAVGPFDGKWVGTITKSGELRWEVRVKSRTEVISDAKEWIDVDIRGPVSESGVQERETTVHAIDAGRSYWARGKVKVGGKWSEWHGIRGQSERRPIEWMPPMFGTYPTKAMAVAAADVWKSGRGGYLSPHVADPYSRPFW